jgi:hypothetical protein
MFDSETRWFIRCDTCPDNGSAVGETYSSMDKDGIAKLARLSGWDIRDGLHRCPDCVREGRTEMAS